MKKAYIAPGMESTLPCTVLPLCGSGGASGASLTFSNDASTCGLDEDGDNLTDQFSKGRGSSSAWSDDGLW